MLGKQSDCRHLEIKMDTVKFGLASTSLVCSRDSFASSDLALGLAFNVN